MGGKKKKEKVECFNHCAEKVLLLFLSPSLHSSAQACFSRCCSIISLLLMMSAITHKNGLEVKLNFGYMHFHLKEESWEHTKKFVNAKQNLQS